MTSQNHNLLIHGWLEKIEKNMQEFRARDDVTDEDRIQFVTHQYHLMMLIYRGLTGSVIFVGAKPIAPGEQQS